MDPAQIIDISLFAILIMFCKTVEPDNALFEQPEDKIEEIFEYLINIFN